MGRLNQSAIATLVDRTSRLVRLVHLPAGHMSEPFTAAILSSVGLIPSRARLTLTWDQGSEMARHDLLRMHFADGVYFANPGSPWLRGSNENMNGLLRQYFPKGGDLSRFSIEDLCRAEELLNNDQGGSWVGEPRSRSSLSIWQPEEVPCCDDRSKPP